MLILWLKTCVVYKLAGPCSPGLFPLSQTQKLHHHCSYDAQTEFRLLKPVRNEKCTNFTYVLMARILTHKEGYLKVIFLRSSNCILVLRAINQISKHSYEYCQAFDYNYVSVLTLLILCAGDTIHDFKMQYFHFDVWCSRIILHATEKKLPWDIQLSSSVFIDP